MFSQQRKRDFLFIYYLLSTHTTKQEEERETMTIQYLVEKSKWIRFFCVNFFILRETEREKEREAHPFIHNKKCSILCVNMTHMKCIVVMMMMCVGVMSMIPQNPPRSGESTVRFFVFSRSQKINRFLMFLTCTGGWRN